MDSVTYAQDPLTASFRTSADAAANIRLEDRRRFLVALCVSVLSGTALSAGQEPENMEDKMGPMDRLGRLDKTNSGNFSTAQAGAAAVPDMEKYVEVLADTERKIPLAEARKAADLLIGRLYYGNEAWNRVRAVPGEHTKVPKLTIRSEAALARRLPNVECEEKDRQELWRRLITDILWYSCYQNDEEVLHFAAEKLCEAVLSAEGPIDGTTLLTLLHHDGIRPSNTVAQRAVCRSYPRIVQWVRTRQLELKKPPADRKEGKHEKTTFLSQLGELDRKLSDFFGEQAVPAGERVKFTAWRQEYLLNPSQEIVKDMMKEELDPASRTAMGTVIARQLAANNSADLTAAAGLIFRWGFDDDAQFAFRTYRNDIPSPYGPHRTTTTLFLDMYRATRGDDGPAKRYVDPADRNNRAALDQVLINDSGVYLATLEALSKNNLGPPPEILRTLERNLYATLRTQVSRIGGVPSLAEWGEVAARFLNIGETPNIEDPHFQKRVKEMKALLVDGFQRLKGDQWEPVAGVFGKHTSEVTTALMREKKVTERREVEELAAKKVAADRAAFIRAFRASVPDLPEQDNILKMLGFKEEELAEAKKSSHMIPGSADMLSATRDREMTEPVLTGIPDWRNFLQPVFQEIDGPSA